jgi:predicted DNA repair protein MutK
MSGGLIALLDDIAALAKLAAVTIDDASAMAVKAGSKAAGVVIDDAAVTPRYVTGLAAKRELPIIARIARGSIRNKLLFLLPAALLLSEFLPQAIMPLLMIGGLFLCYEGYEKVHDLIAGPAHADEMEAAAERVIDAKILEDQRVAGAIRTDFILSAEIMAIALAEITAPDLLTRAIVLTLVALFITGIVYGAVALIVKADDFGVYLAREGGSVSAAFGRALVNGMPGFLKVLAFVGMIAMLWVGGGIFVHGLASLGYPEIEHALHDAGAAVGSLVPAAGGLIAWLVNAAGNGIVGLILGGITALVVHPLLPKTASAKH